MVVMNYGSYDSHDSHDSHINDSEYINEKLWILMVNDS